MPQSRGGRVCGEAKRVEHQTGYYSLPRRHSYPDSAPTLVARVGGGEPTPRGREWGVQPPLGGYRTCWGGVLGSGVRWGCPGSEWGRSLVVRAGAPPAKRKDDLETKTERRPRRPYKRNLRRNGRGKLEERKRGEYFSEESTLLGPLRPSTRVN